MTAMDKFNPNNPWTPERVERLKQLWAADYTAAEIAAIMGAGITRNSVLGKLHRIGGYTRSKHPRQAPSQKRIRRLKPSLAPVVACETISAAEPSFALGEPLPSKPQADTRTTIADLRFPISQCRWIDGEPTHDAQYCGARTRIGKSYCTEHHARLWAPRRRRAA